MRSLWFKKKKFQLFKPPTKSPPSHLLHYLNPHLNPLKQFVSSLGCLFWTMQIKPATCQISVLSNSNFVCCLDLPLMFQDRKMLPMSICSIISLVASSMSLSSSDPATRCEDDMTADTLSRAATLVTRLSLASWNHRCCFTNTSTFHNAICTLPIIHLPWPLSPPLANPPPLKPQESSLRGSWLFPRKTSKKLWISNTRLPSAQRLQIVTAMLASVATFYFNSVT